MTEISASSGGCKLSFCFLAKLLVAIPVLPLIAVAAASFFTDPLMQVVAGAAAVGTTVFVAVTIDRMPFFSGKIGGKSS